MTSARARVAQHFLINGVGAAAAGIIHVRQTLSSIHYARQRAKERTAAQKYKSNVQLRDHFNWTIKRARLLVQRESP